MLRVKQSRLYLASDPQSHVLTFERQETRTEIIKLGENVMFVLPYSFLNYM